jgi:GTP cyclohydrolase II
MQARGDRSTAEGGRGGRTGDGGRSIGKGFSDCPHSLAVPDGRCVRLRAQLELALAAISKAGLGILVYELQEGRGIGLMAKLRAYELQDHGRDTVEANLELGYAADCREFEVPAAVLKELGVHSVRLITNNPEKVQALEDAGVHVTERISAAVEPVETFERYLLTKQEKMGHFDDRAVEERIDDVLDGHTASR